MHDELTEAESATIGAGYCPDCGHAGFRIGPRGGAALNIECMACRRLYCVTPFGWRMLMGQRIERADNVRRARTAYRDDRAQPMACHRCGGMYRGPAVYCSLECAEADA